MIDYEQLWERIPLGRANAINVKTLTDLLGCRTSRQARKDIEEMIYHDFIVCNLRDGYFRPETDEECFAYIDMISSYIKKLGRKRYRIAKSVGDKRYIR